MRAPPPGEMYPVPAPKKINFVRLGIVAFLLFGGIAILADEYQPAESNTPVPSSLTPQTVEVGVSAADVIRLIGKHPDRINRTETATGTTEQWAYENGRNYMYLYLRNNIVTAIQKSW
jgi:hypothetical protein